MLTEAPATMSGTHQTGLVVPALETQPTTNDATVDPEALPSPIDIIDTDKFAAVSQHTGSPKEMLQRYKDDPNTPLPPCIKRLGITSVDTLIKRIEGTDNPAERAPTIRELREARKKEAEKRTKEKPELTLDAGATKTTTVDHKPEAKPNVTQVQTINTQSSDIRKPAEPAQAIPPAEQQRPQPNQEQLSPVEHNSTRHIQEQMVQAAMADRTPPVREDKPFLIDRPATSVSSDSIRLQDAYRAEQVRHSALLQAESLSGRTEPVVTMASAVHAQQEVQAFRGIAADAAPSIVVAAQNRAEATRHELEGIFMGAELDPYDLPIATQIPDLEMLDANPGDITALFDQEDNFEDGLSLSGSILPTEPPETLLELGPDIAMENTNNVEMTEVTNEASWTAALAKEPQELYGDFTEVLQVFAELQARPKTNEGVDGVLADNYPDNGAFQETKSVPPIVAAVAERLTGLEANQKEVVAPILVGIIHTAQKIKLPESQGDADSAAFAVVESELEALCRSLFEAIGDDIDYDEQSIGQFIYVLLHPDFQPPQHESAEFGEVDLEHEGTREAKLQSPLLASSKGAVDDRLHQMLGMLVLLYARSFPVPA